MEGIWDTDNFYGRHGQGFYFLFFSLFLKQTQPNFFASHILAQGDVRRAERHGKQWENFLYEAQDILPLLYACFYSLDHYDQIHKELTEAGHKGEELKSALLAVGWPQGVAATWQELNLLLQQAEEKMQECGLNPKEFYAEGP